MSDKDTKLCINCRWYKRSKMGPFYSECAHTSAEIRNLVTGEVEHRYCDLERAFGSCGRGGLFLRKQSHTKINKPSQTK